MFWTKRDQVREILIDNLEKYLSQVDAEEASESVLDAMDDEGLLEENDEEE